MLNYGEKRDYKKIDLYWRGEYKGSTTWAKTCKEAKTKFLESHSNLVPVEVKARFA